MTPLRSDLVQRLRERGYAVDIDAAVISTCESAELMDCAACFVDSALTVAGRPTSRRAYIRLACSRGQLFIEVTYLGRGTFNALMRDEAAMHALDQLRAWARTFGRWLTVERGPRDQFRITVVLDANAASVWRIEDRATAPTATG